MLMSAKTNMDRLKKSSVRVRGLILSIRNSPSTPKGWIFLKLDWFHVKSVGWQKTDLQWSASLFHIALTENGWKIFLILLHKFSLETVCEHLEWTSWEIYSQKQLKQTTSSITSASNCQFGVTFCLRCRPQIWFLQPCDLPRRQRRG